MARNTTTITRAACRAAGVDIDGPGIIARDRNTVTVRVTGAMARVMAADAAVPWNAELAAGLAYMQRNGGNGHGPNIRWSVAPSACDAGRGRAIGASAASAGVRPAVRPRIAGTVPASDGPIRA